MECKHIAFLKDVNKLCLGSLLLLEDKDDCALHSQSQLYIVHNLADKTLEGCLPDQNISALLVVLSGRASFGYSTLASEERASEK